LPSGKRSTLFDIVRAGNLCGSASFRRFSTRGWNAANASSRDTKKVKPMQPNANYFLFALGKYVKVVFVWRPGKRKQHRKLPSLTTVLLSLIVMATVIALSTAALARDANSFANVIAVWSEIKPLLKEVLDILLKL
jgi:hypothetical protein